jgi:thiol-disulfide isomerase/thioredoxin
MRRLLLILLLLGKLNSFSQNNFHQIQFSLEGSGNAKVYLAHYYGSKVLKRDSITLDQNGKGVFKGKKSLPQGIYLIYLNDKMFFDFLVGADQQFQIKASFQNGTRYQISGSKESEAFQHYQEYLAKQRTKQTKIQKELSRFQDQTVQNKNFQDSLKFFQKDMESLNREMEDYWTAKSAEYNGTFFSDFLKTMIPPKQKEMPTGISDSIKWLQNYSFNRDHYWDNINFKQTGLLYSPILNSRIETYFKNTLLQIPDSVLRPTIQLIDKSKVNEEMFRYIALDRLNSTLKSEVMGMDKVFVEIAERYFLKSKPEWLDSASRAKIIEKVYVTKSNLIGNLAPELKLPDFENNYFSLRQMDGDYTVLYFWEPGCSHCQKTTPLLNEKLFEPLKNKGVQVFAVYIMTNKDEWLKAINQYKIFEWTNVWDPNQDSNFRVLYDVFSTPVLYVLDKFKHIIAKKIDVETAVKIIEEDMSRRQKAIVKRQ